MATGSFPSGSSPGDEECETVITFSGNTVESTENFLLELSSFDSVTVTDPMAIVTIVDNDGKDYRRVYVYRFFLHTHNNAT